MDFVMGYAMIPIAAVLGVAISYMDAKQNNSEKTAADHAKLAIAFAFLAGLVVFINSGEGLEFFTGGASSGAASLVGGASEAASAVISGGANIAPGVASAAISSAPRVASHVVETFATGLANF